MNSCIIDVKSKQWKKALTILPHDIYHLPEYFELSAKLEGGHPVAYLVIDGSRVVFVPILVKELPAEFLGHVTGKDATSPYGYACPLISKCCETTDWKLLLDDMVFKFQSLGLVSVFFRLNPLFELPLQCFSQFGKLVHHGQTVFIDLDKPIEDIWGDFCKNHKRGINKLQKDRYTVVVDEWVYYDKFIDLYQETMERVGATKFYFFGNDYFYQLKNSLGQRLHLFVVLSGDKQVAAGGLFTVEDGIVQYHLGASSSNFLNVAPSKLMFYNAICWAKENDYKIFHLGGGLGAGNDSLFQFKKGFSASLSDFYTWRIILDKARYKILEDLKFKGKEYKNHENDFFPTYRIPD
jgi:hypothetical protein